MPNSPAISSARAILSRQSIKYLLLTLLTILTALFLKHTLHTFTTTRSHLHHTQHSYCRHPTVSQNPECATIFGRPSPSRFYYPPSDSHYDACTRARFLGWRWASYSFLDPVAEMFGEWWAFPVVVGACVWDFERKVPGWWKVTRPLLGVSLLIWVAGVWVRIWREAGEAECFEEAMREVKRNGRWWRGIGGRG